MNRKIALGVGLAALCVASLANAQQLVPVPQVGSVGPTDLFQDVVGGTPSAQNFYASGALLSGYFAQNAQGENFIIGGDAGQNLWQRGTTGSSVTTTVTYGGPDRWAYWSGTNTAITVTRSNTAAALLTGSQQTFRLQRTAAQTGLVQSCMVQAISTQNSFYLAGHTVALDFNVYAGANFSATAMNAYIITGTGSDEGVAGSSSLAFGLNAGGGGSGSWTGQANATTGTFSGMAASTAYRVAAVATIPSTATEVAVALCYTPVGTAGVTDALYFQNVELRKADNLSAFVNATTAYTVTASTANPQQGTIAIAATTTGSNPITVTAPAQNGIIPAFSRRLSAVEAMLQQQYYYELDESATIFGVAPCQAISVTVCLSMVPFPVPMRVAPTMTYANGFATATTTAGGTLGACTTLATSTTVASTAPGVNGIVVSCTAGTVPAAGSGDVLYSNGGTGKIKASAEL